MKTHTFKMGKFYLEYVNRIDGITELPDVKGCPCKRSICIVNGGGYRELSTSLHEAMHADGIPDEYLHKRDGTSDTERIAKFLWRLGYKKTS